MRRSVLALCVLALVLIGCETSPRSVPKIAPYSKPIKSSDYYSKLIIHVASQLGLDQQHTIWVKDLDVELELGKPVHSGTIELRGLDAKGMVKQFRVDLRSWAYENLPVYGYAHEFVDFQSVSLQLDPLDWPSTLAKLGNPPVLKTTLAPDCRVTFFGLFPSQNITDTSLTVPINPCNHLNE